jgi:hypothetical protein
MAARDADVEATVAAMPANENKPFEYGLDNAHAPRWGGMKDAPGS